MTPRPVRASTAKTGLRGLSARGFKSLISSQSRSNPHVPSLAGVTPTILKQCVAEVLFGTPQGCVWHTGVRQSSHAQRLSSPLSGGPPSRGAACRLEPRGGSMTRRRDDGQGTTVPSRLPHPSTAAPRLLPTDPPGDVSPDTVGAEGYPAWAHLAGASDVLVGAHATWQHDGNETR